MVNVSLYEGKNLIDGEAAAAINFGLTPSIPNQCALYPTFSLPTVRIKKNDPKSFQCNNVSPSGLCCVSGHPQGGGRFPRGGLQNPLLQISPRPPLESVYPHPNGQIGLPTRAKGKPNHHVRVLRTTTSNSSFMVKVQIRILSLTYGLRPSSEDKIKGIWIQNPADQRVEQW